MRHVAIVEEEQLPHQGAMIHRDGLIVLVTAADGMKEIQ
jgi:hypothetical protein